MTRYSVEDRYQSDIVFNTLVNNLIAILKDMNYTPTEMREAAMLAQYIIESNTIIPKISLSDINSIRVQK